MQLKHYFFAFLFIILFIPLQAQNFVNETPAEVAVEYSKDLQALLGLNDTELKKVEKIHVKYFRKKERFRYNKTPKHKRIKAIKKRDKAMAACAVVHPAGSERRLCLCHGRRSGSVQAALRLAISRRLHGRG